MTIIEKIKREMNRMNKSLDPDYTKKFIKIKKDTGFSVECMRGDDYDVYDDKGEFMYHMDCSPLEFQVYFVRDGKDIDCCTIPAFMTDCSNEDLEEFVKMWVNI